MNTIQSPYRSTISSYRTRPSRPIAAEATSGQDRVTLSASGESRDLKKMATFGGIGMAVGVAAAALLCPPLGVAGLALGGLVGGIAGAAIGDGALETAGTKKAEEFDPYNTSHVLDPDNLYHPRNPYNPMNFTR